APPVVCQLVTLVVARRLKRRQVPAPFLPRASFSYCLAEEHRPPACLCDMARDEITRITLASHPKRVRKPVGSGHPGSVKPLLAKAAFGDPCGMAMDIEGWLRGLGLEQYAAAFRENEIDEAVLPKLTPDDLKELGVTTVGHRRRMLTAIEQLPTVS